MTDENDLSDADVAAMWDRAAPVEVLTSADARYQKAVDYLVDALTPSEQATFWAYVEGEITEAEFRGTTT